MTIINRQWLVDNLNPKADYTFGQRLTGYLATNLGVLREVQVLRGVCKIGSEIPSPVAPIVKDVLEHANNTLSILSIASLYSTPKDILKGFDRLQDGGMELIRKVGILFKEVIGNFTPWLEAGMFLTGSLAFKNVVRFATVATSVTELTLTASDYRKAKQLEAKAQNEEVKEALAHSKNYYWYKTAKIVSSFAGTLLTIAFVYTGVTLVSTVALSALSLFTLSLSIHADLYKDSGRYEVIKFDKPVTLDESPVERPIFVHV